MGIKKGSIAWNAFIESIDFNSTKYNSNKVVLNAYETLHSKAKLIEFIDAIYEKDKEQGIELVLCKSVRDILEIRVFRCKAVMNSMEEFNNYIDQLQECKDSWEITRPILCGVIREYLDLGKVAQGLEILKRCQQRARRFTNTDKKKLLELVSTKFIESAHVDNLEYINKYKTIGMFSIDSVEPFNHKPRKWGLGECVEFGDIVNKVQKGNLGNVETAKLLFLYLRGEYHIYYQSWKTGLGLSVKELEQLCKFEYKHSGYDRTKTRRGVDKSREKSRKLNLRGVLDLEY